MSDVRAQIVDRLGSFRLSDGVLEVALVKFTSIETGDWWVQRVVDYLPDGMQHPANRMFLPPPSGCEVPFKPTEGRPVYCKECWEKHRPPRRYRY